MITLLLAFVNFVITVALHIAHLSVELAIKAVKTSARLAKRTAKTGVKTAKKVAKSNKESDAQKEETEETNEANIKGNLRKRKGFASIKEKVLRQTKRAIKTALNLSRFCLVLVTCFIFVFGTLMITTSLALVASAGYVALAYDNGNLDGTDDSFDITKDVKGEEEESKNNTAINVDTSTIAGKLEKLAKWYIANVPTYEGTYTNTFTNSRKYYDCDLIKGQAGDDCTGFAAAFASYVSETKVTPLGSSAMVDAWPSATNNGWTKYTRTEAGELQPGDICVKNGHAEVVVKGKATFGWGKIQSEYPSSKNNTLSSAYRTVYRYTGGK